MRCRREITGSIWMLERLWAKSTHMENDAVVVGGGGMHSKYYMVLLKRSQVRHNHLDQLWESSSIKNKFLMWPFLFHKGSPPRLRMYACMCLWVMRGG